MKLKTNPLLVSLKPSVLARMKWLDSGAEKIKAKNPASQSQGSKRFVTKRTIKLLQMDKSATKSCTSGVVKRSKNSIAVCLVESMNASVFPQR